MICEKSLNHFPTIKPLIWESIENKCKIISSVAFLLSLYERNTVFPKYYGLSLWVFSWWAKMFKCYDPSEMVHKNSLLCDQFTK